LNVVREELCLRFTAISDYEHPPSSFLGIV